MCAARVAGPPTAERRRLLARGRRRRWLFPRDVLEHVVDRDASARAAAANLGWRADLVLRQQPSHRRTVATAGQRSRMRGQRRGGRIIDRRRVRSFLRRAAGLGGSRCDLGARLNAPEQLARRDLVLLLLEDFREHAAGRRRDLDRDLVGLQLDQRLVLDDGVADRLSASAALASACLRSARSARVFRCVAVMSVRCSRGCGSPARCARRSAPPHRAAAGCAGSARPAS